MRMYCLTNDKNVSVEDEIHLTLQQALREVETFPSNEESRLPSQEGFHLGFVNDQDEAIQFFRDGDSWELDIPLVDKERGTGALALNACLTTREVQDLVSSFFGRSSSIDALLTLQRQRPSIDDDIQEKLSVERWVLSEDPSVHVLHPDYLLVDQDERVVCDVRVLEPDGAESILPAITKDTGLTLISVDRLIHGHKQKTCPSASSRSQRSQRVRFED
jgi:hypothetical protein